MVVRVDPATLRLPAERAGWAPQGILAYSKICTHAALRDLAVSRPAQPTTESSGPALVCPCHYSTFDVLDGGSVEFGPAGRPLPQLPLRSTAPVCCALLGRCPGRSARPGGETHVSHTATERPGGCGGVRR